MRIEMFFGGLVLSMVVAGLPVSAHGPRHDGRRGDRLPIRLDVVAPSDVGRRGVLQTTRWPLVFRLSVVGSPALVETAEGEQGRREALILDDPDECIDMRDFPINDPGMPYEPCAEPDELYIEFTSERFDSHDLEDDRTGNFLIRDQLVDDPFVEGELLNKPYLHDGSGTVRPVERPQTGGNRLDGYGYGIDDDLVGLVIMADIGGARVFDPDFNLTPGVIRNMSGFLNSISVELLDRRGRTSLLASMHALAGMFEPIALFDLSVDDPQVDYLRRLESGSVEAFRFDDPPADDDELLEVLVSTYSPVEFDLRAVVVEGVGPEFIFDGDDDGKYTAADLEIMGYELLSNPVKVRIRQAFDLTFTDTVLGRTCPSRTLIFFDLDGNGDDGAVSCSGTGGARRLRRIPR